jgi:hypothetical protein
MDDAALDLLLRIVADHVGLAGNLTRPRTAVEPPAGTPRALGRSAPSPAPQPLQLPPLPPAAPPIGREPPAVTSPHAPGLPALRPSRDPNAGCDNEGCTVGPRHLWSIRVRSSSMKRARLADVADLCPAHVGLHLVDLLEAGDVSPSVGPVEVERSQRWLGPAAAAASPTRQRRPKPPASGDPSDRGAGAPARTSPGSPSPSGPDQPPPMKHR